MMRTNNEKKTLFKSCNIFHLFTTFIMDSSSDFSVSIQIFSIISLLMTFCCLLLCCGGYVLSKKEKRKRTQIHFTNHRHPSEAHGNIFTIDLPDASAPHADPTNPSSSSTTL